MNIRKLPLLLTTLLGLAATAFAQTQTTDATVAKITGTATMTLADGSSSALSAGSKVPQGATITTAANSDVYLQTHASTIATLKGNTTVAVEELSVTTTDGKVTEEKTTLNLKSGNLISALDPAKRSVNNYQVRTPKGVAAARGTTFSITVQGTDGASYKVTVDTTTGTVLVTSSSGLAVSVGAGQASVSSYKDGAATAVADLPKTEQQNVVNSMTVAAAALAVAADQGLISTDEFTAATTTIINSAPQAAAAVKTAVQDVVPNNTTLNNTVTNAISTAPTPPAPVIPVPPTITPQPINPQTVSTSH